MPATAFLTKRSIALPIANLNVLSFLDQVTMQPPSPPTPAPSNSRSSPSTFMPPKPPAHRQLERMQPVAQPAPSAPPPSFAQQVLSPVTQQRLMQPPPTQTYWRDTRSDEEELLADDALEPGPPEEPPLAGENVMNIVMVGAECAPWSKTGGLGDVMGALPKAFARRGHRVMVVAPRYENYDNAWETGIRRIFRVCNQDVEVRVYSSSGLGRRQQPPKCDAGTSCCIHRQL